VEDRQLVLHQIGAFLDRRGGESELAGLELDVITVTDGVAGFVCRREDED